VPGEVTREKHDILRQADTIYLDEIRKVGLYDDIWQAFAVLPPVRTVGVMGDDRTSEHVCALRAVTSTDGMTADSYPFEHTFLARTATRIINEVIRQSTLNLHQMGISLQPWMSRRVNSLRQGSSSQLNRFPYSKPCTKPKRATAFRPQQF